MITGSGLRRIIDTGFAFQQAQILMVAVKLDLFTILGSKELTGMEINEKLQISKRGLWDFLDALYSMDFLERKGAGEEALYLNTEDTKKYLDRQSSSYAGGMLEFGHARTYHIWGSLEQTLLTGKAQNDTQEFFHSIYSDAQSADVFLNAMAGASIENYRILADKFDFSNYESLCDIGGATGLLSICVAQVHKKIKCASFDLPSVAPIADRKLKSNGFSERVTVLSGNFLTDSLPKADIITMGMVLHDWNYDIKMHLIRAAFEAIPDYGAFIVIEMMIDDDRKENSAAFLQSLNMLVEFGDAFDFSERELKAWCIEAGFQRFEKIQLDGPYKALAAYKK